MAGVGRLIRVIGSAARVVGRHTVARNGRERQARGSGRERVTAVNEKG